MKKLKGLIRLMRFELPFSAGVCVVMGQMLALGHFASILEIASGFISIFSISASILVLNDYFDVETDRINAPDRPIPANIVTKTEALLFSLFLVALGLLLGYLTGVIAFATVVILLIVGFLYNRKFKKSGLFGNMMVSFSVGMTFIYGGISVGLPFSKTAWFFGVIAALVDLGEEIAADAMDVKGDLLIESNSLAIKYGKRAALTVSGFIFLCVILLSIIPFIVRWFPFIYLGPIAVMDGAIAYSTIRLLKSEGDEGRKYIRGLYLGATLGLILFMVVRLVAG